MLYLMATFWFWLLLAVVLGLGIGWFTAGRGEGRGWRDLVPWGIALGVGALVALLQVLPQRLGYWFDFGVLMLAAYLIGGCFAGLVRDRLSKPQGERPVRAEPVLMPELAAREIAVEPMKTAADLPPEEAPEEAITGLSAPRGGKPDDLTQIYGIDAETADKLNALGLYHYDQLASLTPGHRRWLFRHLGYEGRFPDWWWRWRYDAEQLLAGKSPGAAKTTKSKPSAKPASTTPAPLVAKAGEEDFVGSRPAGLVEPHGGKADDLKRIGGIGKQNEGRLHGLGIWHFSQIAAWNPDEVAWVGSYLAFPGRIEREDWVGQARLLAKGEATDFSKRADSGLVATSRDEANDDGQSNVIVLGKEFSEKPKKIIEKSFIKIPEKPKNK